MIHGSTIAIGATLAAALLLLGALILPVSASAGTQRDQRGQARTFAPPQLGCRPFKHCSKLGVVVRDHRTGAQPGGK